MAQPHEAAENESTTNELRAPNILYTNTNMSRTSHINIYIYIQYMHIIKTIFILHILYCTVEALTHELVRYLMIQNT